MADQGSPRRFARIDRLPPYVFNITAELKMAARRRGEDIIDLSMGNPDGPTPPHIVEKLVTVAQREDTHGYSTSKGIPRLRRAISRWYKDRYEVDIDPEIGSHRHHRFQGRPGALDAGHPGPGRHRAGAQPRATRFISTVP